METVRIRDGKKSDPGSGINIPDPQHCSDAGPDASFHFNEAFTIRKYWLSKSIQVYNGKKMPSFIIKLCLLT
jgi:hypothetical protein